LDQYKAHTKLNAVTYIDEAKLAEDARAIDRSRAQGAQLALAGLPIIKALAVAESGDLARAHAYEEVADYVLFDAKADSLANRPGGLGSSFDWRLLAGVSIKRPWGLAGGLTPENVARAIQVARPHFVDTSSGVEDSPGRKSREKIAAFLKATRNAQYTDAKTGAA